MESVTRKGREALFKPSQFHGLFLWAGEKMRKQKEDFVTRAEFEELRAMVSTYSYDLIKLLEDRLVCMDSLEDIKDQINGRPVTSQGRLIKMLRKERGLSEVPELKKGHVLKMVPKPK
ncbi:MAG: hypothetical protein NTY86_14340 [Deltaproteobacteria bacterium]|nr:hypothetical protein [Deltaproteobacteria bacterium]